MLVLRSLAFNIYFFLWCGVVVLATIVLAPFPRIATQRIITKWMRVTMWFLRFLVGVRYEFRGLENLPEGPAVIASKHQSAWDTGCFFLVTPDPAYVLKKELLSVPFYGWTLKKAEMIAIDRKAGMGALRKMLRDAGRAVAEDRKIIIFPEGTRTTPGTSKKYHPGVAALYSELDVPFVPVALNSGCFWGRRSFMKYPGVIAVEFLPPMPKGLERRDFLSELKTRIDAASERLRHEAEAKYPVPRRDDSGND